MTIGISKGIQTAQTTNTNNNNHKGRQAADRPKPANV